MAYIRQQVQTTHDQIEMAVGAVSCLCLLLLCWMPLYRVEGIRFASYNVQSFGKKKMNNTGVVDELVSVRQFDRVRCILQPRHKSDKQRFLTPGHQGWNDLHSLCRIGMECYLLNNDDNNIIYWIMMIIMIMMMMIIIMIIMMTMMIIGTATIMIMIIIITTTLTMTIMKMIMIKIAQTPCQSLYKDRRI